MHEALQDNYTKGGFGRHLTPGRSPALLIIAGLSTSGCVRASAVDSCQHGFIPVVVREAVGDRAREPHESNLFDLQAKYAEVVSLDSALAYIKDVPPGAAHPVTA